MQVWLYAVFVAFILLMLAIDLGVLNRGARVFGAKRALAFTGATVVLALSFGVFVYWAYDSDFAGLGTQFQTYQQQTLDGNGEVRGAASSAGGGADAVAPALHGIGRQAVTQYITGWVVEYSLSLDNIFVIALILGAFKVPPSCQHSVLFWGVLGALVLRGVMIGAGASLLAHFHWMIYVFGGFLVITAAKLLLSGDGEVHPDRNWAVRIARRFYPVSRDYEGQKFFTMVDGRRAITPLFLVLLVVETTDVVFAVDSIPAIFGITRDPFLVFTSNVFAILGLRSLYFALAAIMVVFRYLKVSLVVVLGFVGVKMSLAGVFHIDAVVSLGIILGTLVAGVLASVLAGKPPPDQAVTAGL